MKKIAFYLSILMVIGFVACERKSAVTINADLQLKMGTVCGWCAGGDSLIINAHNTVYKYYPSCDQSKAKIITATTEKAVWEKLVSLLDKKKFNNIHLNICNVCADGCDISITVTDQNYNHTISYGGINNAAVVDVRPLIKELEALRVQYYNEQQQ